MTTVYAPIGSISHATMRPEDLIPAFADELERLNNQQQEPTQWAAALVAEARAIDFDAAESDENADALDDLINSLSDALLDFAAPYCYFGAHQGDGADYGFWLNWEAIEDARQGGELASGDELPCACCSEHGEFLQVNDHGNAALYARTRFTASANRHGIADVVCYDWTEVWSCV